MSFSRLRPQHALLPLAAWLLMGGLSACLDAPVVTCSDGRLCPEHMACDEAHQGCVLPQQVDTCASKGQGADCAYRGMTHGACYEHVCLPSGCGNGIVDTGEVCDDGNRLHGDGCSADCRSKEVCGNGVIDVAIGESCEPTSADDAWCRKNCVSVRCGDGVRDTKAFELCDEGDKNSDAPNAACRPNCQPRRCGDGTKDKGEVCDDGNSRSGDGCSADCKSDETCGNGVVDVTAGEQCEPDAKNKGFCREDCTTARCGDGKLDSDVFEQCDNGQKNSNDKDAQCRPNCQLRRCGDGTTDSDEVCDDGNHENGDGCTYDCKSDETCGNGYTDLTKGEQCDDGGFMSHDGCSSLCMKETPAWTSIVNADGPVGTGTSYDVARDAVLAFIFSRTYELRGTAFQQLNPQHQPGIAYDPATIWDSARQRILFFGGADGDGVPRNETWEWDGRDWLRLRPAKSPPGRQYPVMVYDGARKRAVMFGGTDWNAWFTDTWEWDGTTWELIAETGGPTTPAAQGDSTYAATYDPVTAKVAAFDGTTLWTFEKGAWKSAAAALPEQEQWGARSLVFDPERGHLIYRHPAGTVTDPVDTLYEWDGAAWQKLAGPPGSGSVDAKLVYRIGRRRLALVGSSVIWERDGDSWVKSDSKLTPALHSHGAMVYDPLRGSTLLFGGALGNHPVDGPSSVADTWLWNGATWSNPTPATTPPARALHALAYDIQRRQIVMYGGGDAYDHTQPALDDTWTWDGADWSPQAVGKGPPARQEHAMAYDMPRGQVVLFGGASTSNGPYLHDLWTWDGKVWTEQDSPEPPNARAGHGMSYDPIRREVLMAGGYSANVPDAEEPAWTWNSARWQTIDVPGLAERFYFAMPYDGNRKATLMIGGAFVDSVHSWFLPAVAASAPQLPWEPVPVPFSRDPDVSGQEAVYEPLQGRTLAWANSDTPMWTLSYRAGDALDEVCQAGFDIDGDGLIGCDDPDCWGYCTPLCPPGAECDATLSRCGDGTCNTALETYRMCPQDCKYPPLCGDSFCDPGETLTSCPGDCTP